MILSQLTDITHYSYAISRKKDEVVFPVPHYKCSSSWVVFYSNFCSEVICCYSSLQEFVQEFKNSHSSSIFRGKLIETSQLNQHHSVYNLQPISVTDCCHLILFVTNFLLIILTQDNKITRQHKQEFAITNKT